ncbi:MAG: DUF4129 domain-containing protein [Mycobacterium sp.]|nr:DUF4129 domain-containing protein [Mycobacterium sp.]
MPAIDIDRDGAHEAARHELAKPIYPKASLSDRIDDWLREFLFRLIQKGSSIPGGWFTITLLAVIALIAGLVAVRIARRTMGSRREAQLFGPHALSAAEYRARAQEAAAQGDWSSAIRQRLRAVGRQLEEDGVLSPVPGRTSGELARDAGQDLPDLYAELHAAANAFNDVTYGGLPGTAPNYRLVADLDDRVRHHEAIGHVPVVTAETWTPLR